METLWRPTRQRDHFYCLNSFAPSWLRQPLDPPVIYVDHQNNIKYARSQSEVNYAIEVILFPNQIH